MKRDILKKFEQYREAVEAQIAGVGPNCWRIDGVDEAFRTLEDAKCYIANYTENDLRGLRDCSIAHFVGDDVISLVRIIIDDKGVRYSRPVKC